MTHTFDVNVAKLCGVHAAIILHNIAFWIEKNKANRNNFFEGRYWTYNSKRAMAELFPYLTERQVKYALEKLRDEGLLLVARYNKVAFDQTLWYALSDKAITEFYPQLQANSSVPADKIVHPTSDKNVRPIPDSKPYNKQYIYGEAKQKTKKKFIPPTLEEVKAYAESRGNLVDAKRFFDYFEASNWVDSQGKSVRNWKQKMITWETHSNGKPIQQQQQATPSLDLSSYDIQATIEEAENSRGFLDILEEKCNE